MTMTDPTPHDELATALTIRDYARRMRLSQNTVRNQVKSGRLRALRPSARVTYIPYAEYLRTCAEMGIDPVA
jgi:hypothetical protein